jgi:hypothetical protein
LKYSETRGVWNTVRMNDWRCALMTISLLSSSVVVLELRGVPARQPVGPRQVNRSFFAVLQSSLSVAGRMPRGLRAGYFAPRGRPTRV